MMEAGKDNDISQQYGNCGEPTKPLTKYSLELRNLIEILAASSNILSQTNKKIESIYKTKINYTTIDFDTFSQKIWGKSTSQVNKNLLYSIQTQPPFLKMAITKRSDIIGHMKIMITNLMQKKKEISTGMHIEYTTEEDLFNHFVKLFNLKLFESPIFRKVMLIFLL